MEDLKLINQSSNLTIASKVEVAEGFFNRAKGLLGRSHLPEGHTLWIKNCRDIHTWFMQFAIDVVFVDKNLKVKAIFQNVKPWKLIFIFGANSVFEMPAGTLQSKVLNKGDQLHVGH